MQKDVIYALGAIKSLPDDKQVLFKVANDIGWFSAKHALNLLVIELETSTVGHYEIAMWSQPGIDFNLKFDSVVATGLGLPNNYTDVWWCIKFAHFEQEVYAMSKDLYIFFTL
jgi:hypothetical protein